MAHSVELSESADRELSKLDAQTHPEVPSRTSRQAGRSAQHRRGPARRAAWGVLEIPRRRLPAHLEDRRRPSGCVGPPCRTPQGNLSLMKYRLVAPKNVTHLSVMEAASDFASLLVRVRMEGAEFII